MIPLEECAARMKGHRVALALSGGKDSMATLHHLLPLADQFVVYYMNPGDPDPKTLDLMEKVKKLVPHFVMVTGDVHQDRRVHGFPSDVVPVNMTALMQGMLKDPQVLHVQSTIDCCSRNRMLPLYERMLSDGVTMIIRGQKDADHMKNMLAVDGYVDDNLIEFFYPINDETTESVMEYLTANAPEFIHEWYVDGGSEGSIDCVGCTGWWGEIGEKYLGRHYPDLLARRQFVREVVKKETLACNWEGV